MEHVKLYRLIRIPDVRVKLFMTVVGAGYEWCFTHPVHEGALKQKFFYV